MATQALIEKQPDRILKVLRRLFPRSEMNRILDDLAGKRMPRSEFKTFVWHTMAKTAAQKVAGRPWERVDGDLRHQATLMSVIYAMHCLYERHARGRGDLESARNKKPSRNTLRSAAQGL